MKIDNLTKDFVEKHLCEDVASLALKADKYSDIDFTFALQQIAGRQKAKYKLPSWYELPDIIYPNQLAMEQCSSELTALYKASIIQKGNIFVDLTGGLGIDFSFIAPLFDKAIYIEQQSQLTMIAKHNFDVLKLQQIIVIEDESIHALQNFKLEIDTLYIDPARRSISGKKTVLIEDCSPDLTKIDSLMNKKAKNSIIKLSPMLDIAKATEIISNLTEIHVLSVGNECKELIFVKKNKATNVPTIHCINIISNKNYQKFNFTKVEESNLQISYTSVLEKYLYEPNSAILKAGAYKSVADRFKINKLNPNSHLYTSNTLIDNFPGRKFLIKKIFHSNKKELKAELKNISQANITIRNYPLSVDLIRKQFKIREGGDIYLFATTLSNEKKVVILCSKLP